MTTDGMFVVSGGADKLLKVWTAADGKPARDIPGGTAAITRVDVRKDNLQVAAGDATGVVRLFNFTDGVAQQVLGAHTGEITGLVYAPNNGFFLTAGADGLVKRWPVQFTAPLNIAGHGDVINVVALRPDGNWIATGSNDKTARLWDRNNGQPIRNLDGHPEAVTAIAFSPNQAWVLTGCADKIARLFDANNGQVVKAFAAQAGAITAVAVNPNHQEIAVGDATGVVKIYKTADGAEVRPRAAHRPG